MCRVRLMSVVGINDFSMRELRKPEAPGVRRILSAVINFIRFRENSMNDLDQQMRRSVSSSRVGCWGRVR